MPSVCLKVTEPSSRECISLWLILELGEASKRLFNAISTEVSQANLYVYPTLSFLAGLPSKESALDSGNIQEMGAHH